MTQHRRRWLIGALVVIAAVLHALLLADNWRLASSEEHGRDFASFYYASKVASAGQDPYNGSQLSKAASTEGARTRVYPYFYPPPFLALMSWCKGLSLTGAYRLWFWVDELFAWLCALILIRWWAPLGPSRWLFLLLPMLSATTFTNNHLMGQVNLMALTLTLGGLAAQSKGRPWLGGLAVGTACMIKMSPALFVLYWLVQRRYKAVAGSLVAAVLLSLLSLTIVSFETQLRFYSDILPGLFSGDYNGLRIPISIFGNHSPSEFFHSLLPGARTQLSTAGRLLSVSTTLGCLLLLFRSCSKRPQSALHEAAQVSAVALTMLLIPLYTYEHHMVWAWPAIALLCYAAWQRIIDRRWLWLAAALWLVWATQLMSLKLVYVWIKPISGLLGWCIKEAKFLALVSLFIAMLRLERVFRRRSC